MTELRTLLSASGLDVRLTYGQSGNVIFDSPRRNTDAVADQIETALAPRLGQRPHAFVLPASELTEAADHSPQEWTGDGREVEHFVIFVDRSLAPRHVIDGRHFDPDTERLTPARHWLYWDVRKERRAHSALATLSQDDAYRHMTIRSARTVRRLGELCRVEGTRYRSARSSLPRGRVMCSPGPRGRSCPAAVSGRLRAS